jgi:DnaJ-class molecular chaperone
MIEIIEKKDFDNIKKRLAFLESLLLCQKCKGHKGAEISLGHHSEWETCQACGGTGLKHV